MGKVQSSLETKLLDEVPPWDLETIVKRTDLDEETANACWRMWTDHPLVSKGQMKEEDFYELLDIPEGNEDERRLAKKSFELLDRDDDERLEFPDLMIFLFSLEDLSDEAKLRRSFLFYDRNGKGNISKEEMVEVLDTLEQMEMEHDDKGKVVIPDNVENLFSLIDFAHDGRIRENEFLKAANHYRNLGKMLTIYLLERSRKYLRDRCVEHIEREKKEEEEKKLRKSDSVEEKEEEKEETKGEKEKKSE